MTTLAMHDQDDSQIRNWESVVVVHDRLPIPEPLDPLEEEAVVAAHTLWETTKRPATEIVELAVSSPLPRTDWPTRLVGVRMVLHWLETFDGDTWQQRWQASGVESSATWMEDIADFWNAAEGTTHDRGITSTGVAWMAAVDAIRPSLEWMHREHKSLRVFPHAILGHRDPGGRDQIEKAIEEYAPREVVRIRHTTDALHQLGRILAHTGHQRIRQVEVDDILDDREAAADNRKPPLPSGAAYNAMYVAKMLPEGSPERFIDLRRTRQLSVTELIDRTGIQSPAVKAFFID